MLIAKCAIDDNLLAIVHLVKDGLMPMIQIFVPILLIIMGTIDLGKIIITSDEKEMKQTTKKLVRRIAFAIACFFIVTFVKIITNLLADTNDENVYNTNDCTWKDYWYN